MNRSFSSKDKTGPFDPKKSDGCTVLSKPYKWITGKKLSFRACCMSHDEKYWYSGTKEQRQEADADLRECVKCSGNGKGCIKRTILWVLSWVMYAAVRVFGSPLLPTPFRWQIKKPKD